MKRGAPERVEAYIMTSSAQGTKPQILLKIFSVVLAESLKSKPLRSKPYLRF